MQKVSIGDLLRDEEGRPPVDAQARIRQLLTEAIDNQDIAQVELLMSELNDVNAQDLNWQGYLIAPIHYAVCQNKARSVGAILKFSVDLETRDSDHDTPIIDAASRGYNEIVQLLIDAGAEVNVQGGHERTPIIRALLSGGESSILHQTIDTLARAGADIYIKDVTGKSAFDLISTVDNSLSILKFLYKNDSVKQWQKESDLEISFHEFKGDYKLTRYFNFKAMECVTFSENVSSKTQSHNIEAFDKVSQKKMIIEAAKQHRAQGGKIPQNVDKKIQTYGGQKLSIKPRIKTH